MSTKTPTSLPTWWQECIDRREHDNHGEDTPPPQSKRRPSLSLAQRFHDASRPDDLQHWRKLMP